MKRKKVEINESINQTSVIQSNNVESLAIQKPSFEQYKFQKFIESFKVQDTLQSSKKEIKNFRQEDGNGLIATQDNYHFTTTELEEKVTLTNDKLSIQANYIHITCLAISQINELLIIVDSKNQINLQSYRSQEFIYRFQSNLPIINSIWVKELYIEEVNFVEILFGTMEGLFKSRLQVERVKKGQFNDKFQKQQYKNDFIKNKVERDQTWMNWMGLQCSTFYHKNILELKCKQSFRVIVEQFNLPTINTGLSEISNFEVFEKFNLLQAWNKNKASISQLNKLNQSTIKRYESLNYQKSKEFETETIQLGGGVKFIVEEEMVTCIRFFEPYIVMGNVQGELKYIQARATGEIDKTKTLRVHSHKILNLAKSKIYKNTVISIGIDNFICLTQLDCDNTFQRMNTGLKIFDAIIFKPNKVIIKEQFSVKLCSLVFNYQAVLIQNAEDLTVKKLIYKDLNVFVYLTNEDSLRVYNRKNLALKSLVFGPPGNHKILTMIYLHQIDRLFVLQEKGVLIAQNVAEETAQISECQYLNKISDKNLIQINMPPREVCFNFHDIPDLDLECVDEQNDEDPTLVYQKNFVMTKQFSLDQQFQHCFLLCSQDNGSIVGTPFLTPQKIQMRQNHIKGSLSSFNVLGKNKMIFVVDKFTINVVETKVITPQMVEGKSKMEIEGEVIKLVFTVTYPHEITFIKVVDMKIQVGTNVGQFDIIKHEDEQFQIISTEAEVRHDGPILDIEVTPSLLMSRSSDSMIQVWNHDKQLLKAWETTFPILGQLSSLQDLQDLQLVAETSLQKIRLAIDDKWFDQDEKLLAWHPMDFFFMKNFFEKRNFFFGFTKPFIPSKKRQEPLVSTALEEMGKQYDPHTLNINKQAVDEHNVQDEFESIMKKEALKDKQMKHSAVKEMDEIMNQSGTNLNPKKKRINPRSKSEVPKTQRKKESTSSELISPQTNLLAAWNILKPYNPKEYSFLKASDHDQTCNILFQRPDIYQVKHVESQDQTQQDHQLYLKIRSGKQKKAIPDQIVDAQKQIQEAEARIEKMKQITRRELTDEKIKYNMVNYGMPSKDVAPDLSLNPVAKLKIPTYQVK